MTASSGTEEAGMSTLAENGSTYSSEEIVRDPESYMRQARAVRGREAHEYVAQEIARRAHSFRDTRADLVARLATNLAMAGALIALAVSLVGILMAR
jgi:hypothetical protein